MALFEKTEKASKCPTTISQAGKKFQDFSFNEKFRQGVTLKMQWNEKYSFKCFKLATLSLSRCTFSLSGNINAECFLFFNYLFIHSFIVSKLR